MFNAVITWVARRLGWDPEHDRAETIAVLVAVVLALVGVLSARPAWHAVRSWRTHRLVARAENLLAAGDWQEATRKASAALVLERWNLDALRTAARAQTQGNRPAAVTLWKMYLEKAQASPAEHREFAGLALRHGALDIAKTQLLSLLPGHWNDPELLWLGAQIAMAFRDLDEARHYADLAERFAPTNLHYRLVAASLRLQSAKAADRQQARQTLMALSKFTNNLGLEAIDQLARNREVSRQDRSHLLQDLQRRPVTTLRERLLELDLALATAHDKDQKRWLESALQTWGSTDATNRTALGSWSNGRRRYDFTLQLIPPDIAFTDPRLFTLRVDALAGLGQWLECVEQLDHPRNPLSKVVSAAYRARAARALNDTQLASTQWRRAAQAAGDDPSELAFLAGYAEAAAEWDTARDAYKRLAAAARDSWMARSAESSFLQRHGTTVELRDCIRSMSEQWPDHVSLRNDLAYLNLLLGTDVPAAVESARQLVQQYPESIPHRATLALGLVRQGLFADALEVFSGRDIDWTLALPGNRAVYAAALLGAGRRTEAHEHARAILPGTVRPEEYALVEPALALAPKTGR